MFGYLSIVLIVGMAVTGRCSSCRVKGNPGAVNVTHLVDQLLGSCRGFTGDLALSAILRFTNEAETIPEISCLAANVPDEAPRALNFSA
jgi:hypothetical protein